MISDPQTRIRLAWRLIAATTVLVASLALAACGSDDDSTTAATVQTTTVTTAEAEAAAAGTTTTGETVSDAGTGTDAAQAVPGDDAAVLGAEPEAGTATTEPATTTPSTDPAATTTTPSTDPAATTATAPSTAPTGVTPIVPATPVLGSAGGDEAILSRPFASDSPWNTPVSGQPVDPRSAQLMKDARRRVAFEELPNGEFRRASRFIQVGLTTNVTRWTVPVFSDAQSGAVERVAVCRQFDCGPDAVSSVVIPPDACPDPKYDGWMTAIDNSARIAYDFWRARCERDGSISYHYVKAWELDGLGFQAPGEVSARGSGLPLFAGLITPEEIRDGRIDHALAISVPGAAQRRYVQPASRTDGTGLRTSLPAGARIRLKPGAGDLLTRTFVRSGTQRETAMTIIAALERYGAIVVDRSAAPTMYAQRNADWTGILPLNLLQDIGLGQFEVMRLGQILLDPPRVGEESTAAGSSDPASVPGTTSGSQATTGEFSTPDATGLVP